MFNVKNNTKIRTWDNVSYVRKGIIVLTGRENPYAKNTLEFHLINFIIKYKGQTLNSILNITQQMIDYLKEKKFFYSLDPWSLYDLSNKAVWLALNAGCIKFKNTAKSKIPRFAVFLESGLLDLLYESEYISKLIKECPGGSKRLEHLRQVAWIASKLKKEFKFPMMKKTANKIEITNFNHWIYEKAESIPIASSFDTLPLQTWYQPHSSYVKANSRGIFHHLGDEMAFITAAIQYGECYVVGNDEFGDLMVLASIPYNGESNYASVGQLQLGEICDPMDFEYVYGVPRSNAMYPSQRNNIFNYSSEESDQCIFNTAQNAQLSDAYWNNEVFMKFAHRKLYPLTVKGLKDRIVKTIESVFTREDKLIYENIFKIKNIEKLRILLKFDAQAESHLIRLSKLGYKGIDIPQSIYKDINEFSSSFKEWKKEAFTPKGTLYELDAFHKYFFDSIKPNLKKLLANFPLEQKQYIKLMEDSFNLLYEFKKLTHKYDKEIQDKLSFFYKTVAHKVHCDVLNPKKIDEFGFFMKDGDEENIHLLNLSSLLEEIIKDTKFASYHNQKGVNTIAHSLESNQGEIKSYFKYFKEDRKNHYYLQLLKTSFGGQLNIGEKFDELIDYWNCTGVPAFVVSELIDMQNEYRIFIINHKPVAATACFRNTTPFNAWDKGVFDPRLCNGHSALDTFESKESRSRVAQYAKFARKFCREMKIKYPEQANFVLDVAFNQDMNNGIGGVVAIEINSITWSGAYQLDFRKVCAAIADVPSSKEYITQNYHYRWADYKKLLIEAEKELKQFDQQKSNKTDLEVEEFLFSLEAISDSLDADDPDLDDDELSKDDFEFEKIL